MCPSWNSDRRKNARTLSTGQINRLSKEVSQWLQTCVQEAQAYLHGLMISCYRGGNAVTQHQGEGTFTLTVIQLSRYNVLVIRP